ncbi:MAG: thioesterase family protein [Thermotogota bacterium]
MIDVGSAREQTWTVERSHLASAFGSGLVEVLATPVLVGFCEECARRLVDPGLAPGQKTVGASITLDHLAATPPGMTVTVHAMLAHVDGRRLTFQIEARDDVEVVGRATHVRYVIDAARFEARVAQKVAQSRTEGVAQTRTGGAAQARTTGAV